MPPEALLSLALQVLKEDRENTFRHALASCLGLDEVEVLRILYNVLLGNNLGKDTAIQRLTQIKVFCFRCL